MVSNALDIVQSIAGAFVGEGEVLGSEQLGDPLGARRPGHEQADLREPDLE